MRAIGPNSLSLLLFILAFGGDSPHAEKLPLSIEFEVGGVTYVETIPKPEEVIGHRIGTRHSAPHQIVAYFEKLALVSDRVLVRRHGSTYEGRPQIHAIVTSVENHARLEQLRQNNLRLSESPETVNRNEIRQMPAIVTMGYSIHGNEASGSEAAMLLLYHLAAGQGVPVESILNDMIVIIDPMLNPDGRNRFVNWVNGNRGRVATTDPQDREHREPWPGGRTNHYWFDLNRDWLPAQLEETKGRLQLFHHWRPQVMTDFHEMGSDATYFFQPGVPSRTNPLTPPATSDLTSQIATYHARALDDLGSLYYSEETFDDFYYGKGSTYPDINGGVGILFEQAHSRSLHRQTKTGVLDYDFTIRNQAATSLSTLEAVIDLREQLLNNQQAFYLEARELARKSPFKAYLFDKSSDGHRGLTLIDILLRHRIKVYELNRDREIEGMQHKRGETVIVPTAQPQIRLLSTIMEDVREFADASFYDVSAWTLPRALGVEVKKFGRDISDLLGEEINEGIRPQGRLSGGESSYAYLMEWGDFSAPKCLYRLQASGVATRFLVDPVEVVVNGESRAVDRGTIVISVVQKGVHAQRVHEAVRQVVQEDGAQVLSVSTGLTKRGPDLGSPASKILERPRIALLSGPGTNQSQVGEAWFLLNEQMGIPASLVDVSILGNMDLSRYNTMVVAGGSYKDLPEGFLERLKVWIGSGGLLITMSDAARWAIEQKLVDENLRESENKAANVPYSEVRRSQNAQQISGAIFEVLLDNTHPIAFGHRPLGSVFRAHTIVVEPSKSPGSNVAVYSDAPLLSGYVSKENLEHLKGGASIISRKVGSGAVILFVDNPNFRAFWQATSSLFLNAVFFGRSL